MQTTEGPSQSSPDSNLADQPLEIYSRVRQQLVADPASAPSSSSKTPVPNSQQEPLGRSEVVTGYEYEKNRYIPISEEELKQAAPDTSTEIQILQFVHLEEIDPVFFETSYYLVPEESGKRAYALLFQAMRESRYVALAEIAMHRRDHVLAVRPGSHGLIVHTMFYADEVRAGEEYRADGALAQPREMQLAKQLIQSLAAPFDPAAFTDKYRASLQSIIENKTRAMPALAAPEARQPAEVVDILSALRSTLALVKKPAAKADATKRRSAS